MICSKYLDAFSWTNTKFIDDAVKTERINGRIWAAFGKLQTVTFVGILKEVTDESSVKPKHMLYVGVAKQHPCDRSLNFELAEEVASTNAHMKPIIVMEVDKYFDNIDFLKMIKKYYFTNIHYNLKFVKTTQEINNAKCGVGDLEWVDL